MRPPLSPDRPPPTARADDANSWTTGQCWLWCGREPARVLRIGSATTLNVTADVFACTACVRILADRIIDTHIVKDTGAGDMRGPDLAGTPSHHSHRPPTGRHRRLP
ncbi:hypothetical protein [Actinacidiphila acididurans]|uniref:Uncharacterized protein n=1 Tax=Actinacidiphila acididurans TaxID=2784346 RepID=A0ABS2U003_9ACTN|nr:hypothetical protein [Actinacidiphila acididurans]MBM9508076.1 hypothetical protein [Actinacidiphila acididurans]